MKKKFSYHFPGIVAYFFVLLFVYAALSKLLDFEAFQVQLAQSPLLSAYAGFISYAVIIVELIIAALLCINSTRLPGLYASFGLMVSFTVYIYLILNFSDFVPCSCGGILEKLGWTEHMIFNVACIALALGAIIILERQRGTNRQRYLILSGTIGVISCGLVIFLFISSEHIMKTENNFTRRFLQYPMEEDKKMDLGANSYYFAGAADDKIYLGNYTTPLILTTIDTALVTRTSFTSVIDSHNHSFRSIQMQVQKPYYYIYDGNVPVIYRGELGKQNAKTISYKDAYFNQIIPLDSARFAIRTQSSETQNRVLGILDLQRKSKVKLYSEVLEKQKDGIFDSDGKMIRDPATGKILYTYFYRNQFMEMDHELTVLRKLHTIDTVTRAQIQVTQLKDGQHKMSAPPLTVNKDMVAYRKLLFNESNLMGKHESRKAWKQAAIVDVYRTDQQEYVGSFYVFNRGKDKMSQMLVTDKYFYILIGNEIVRYRLYPSLTRHFSTGKAENL
ncbi:tellurium resistance protein TerC [Chryseobacterium pennae]|uniref:Tellurium resistance protein TerC n=1 Tax=Chryseobacterium pennae TaxID=2258962 RepID=A0A3D9C455_9FLAO|nr:MauE/DoxX family redox-associated membrane protein [Chryseobacterium pennae]REC60488.1 tellurium resistance protein TerC [Chryseobacterium pennae]